MKPPKMFWMLIIFVFAAGVANPSLTQDTRLQVVASHAILGDVVQTVVGETADVSLLIPSGADPHSFEPTPRDLVHVADADVVFINGAQFEEGLLDDIEAVAADGVIYNASANITLLSVGSSEPCDPAEHDEHDETDDHEAHDELDNHDEHGHGACDPHVWMNPDNVITWTETVRDVLIELDPANAEIVTANAASYIEELEELAVWIDETVETLPQVQRVLVTNHDSLGYFAASYDFRIVSTVFSSTAAEPSAADIARVIDIIRAEGVPAVFAETTVRDTIAEQIARETGASLHVLYSGSLGDADSPADTYINYMRYNVQTIVDALSN